MKFDFKNIIIGIVIGVLGTLVISLMLTDIYIDIRIGDVEKQIDEL